MEHSQSGEELAIESKRCFIKSDYLTAYNQGRGTWIFRSRKFQLLPVLWWSFPPWIISSTPVNHLELLTEEYCYYLTMNIRAITKIVLNDYQYDLFFFQKDDIMIHFWYLR